MARAKSTKKLSQSAKKVNDAKQVASPKQVKTQNTQTKLPENTKLLKNSVQPEQVKTQNPPVAKTTKKTQTKLPETSKIQTTNSGLQEQSQNTQTQPINKNINNRPLRNSEMFKNINVANGGPLGNANTPNTNTNSTIPASDYMILIPDKNPIFVKIIGYGSEPVEGLTQVQIIKMGAPKQ